MTDALSALAQASSLTPSEKRVRYQACLTYVSKSKGLTDELSTLSAATLSAVSFTLVNGWTPSNDALTSLALQVGGYLLSNKSFIERLTGTEQSKLLAALLMLVTQTTHKGEARLAFWCLSRQTFDPAILEEHLPHMLSAVALGLATSNKWESMQCVQFGLKCISTLARQVPAALQASANLWLPLVWNLLLVQPVTDYEQQTDQKHPFSKLREEAYSTFQAAKAGLTPLSGDLLTKLVKDLTGGRAAAQPADSAGFMKTIWNLTKSCWKPSQQSGSEHAHQVVQSGGNRRHLVSASGTPSSRPDQATLSTGTLSGAISAVKAWGCYVEMLGPQFLQKDPPVGQPMLKLLERTFTYNGHIALPEATFSAWQKLTEVLHACGQLERRSQLLLNPVTFALNSDKRPEVHQAAVKTWCHMLGLVNSSFLQPFGTSVASAARLLRHLIDPVLQSLLTSSVSSTTSKATSGSESTMFAQALQQLLQTFTNAPALITLLDALGKAILAVVQQQHQADALAQELPLLAAAFDHASCYIQAPGQMQQQSKEVLSKYYRMLWSVFETYRGHQNAVQPVWLPALQSLVTSFSTTARVAADAAKQSNPAAGPQLWFDLVDSMLDDLVRQPSLGTRSPLMPLPGGTSMVPLEVILYAEWSKLILVLPSKLHTIALTKLGSILTASEENAAPVKQIQQYWQHCGFVTTQTGSSNTGIKPASAHAVLVSLHMWKQLADMLSRYLPRTDEFEGSDAALMAALAFAVEVLKYPFETLCHLEAAVLCVVNTAGAAAQAAVQVAGGHQQDGGSLHPGEKPGTQTGSPDGLLRGQGRVHNRSDGDSPQCSRTAAPTKASLDKQSSPSSSPNAAVELNGQRRTTEVDGETLMAFGCAWKVLYKALHEVASRKKSSRTQTLPLLLAYLLSLRQPVVEVGNKPSTVYSKPVTWLLGAVTPAIIQQAGQHGSKKADDKAHNKGSHSEDHTELSAACQLTDHCLDDMCQAGSQAALPVICQLLESVPSICTQAPAAVDLQQQLPLRGLSCCFAVPTDLAGLRDFLSLLEVAWSSMLKCVHAEAYAGLSQSCVAKQLLQPLAAALRHPSQVLHDAAEDFWASSGVVRVLQGYDVGLVESALQDLQTRHSQHKPEREQNRPQPVAGTNRQAFGRTAEANPEAIQTPATAKKTTLHTRCAGKEQAGPIDLTAAKPKRSSVQSLPDAASSKKRSRQIRSPFDESQTDYVKIPSAVKRRSVEALTEHQQEVAARQKAGAAREGIVTYTTLDASQHSQGAPPNKPLQNKPYATRRASAPSHLSPATVTPFGDGPGIDHAHAQPSRDDLARKASPAADLPDSRKHSHTAELPLHCKAACNHADKGTAAQPQSMHSTEVPKPASAAQEAAVEAVHLSAAAPTEERVTNPDLVSHRHKAGTQSPHLQKPADQSSFPTHPLVSSGLSAPQPNAASGAGVLAVAFPCSQHSTSQHGGKATLASMSTGPSHQAEHDTPELDKPARAVAKVQESMIPGQVDSEQAKQQPDVAAAALPEARVKQSIAGPEQVTAVQQLQREGKGASAQPGRTSAAEVLPTGMPIQASSAQKPAQAVSHASKNAAAPGEWLRKRSSSDSREAQTTTKADAQPAAAPDDSAAQETCATSGSVDRNVTKPQSPEHDEDGDIHMASSPNADADKAASGSVPSKAADEQRQQASAQAGRLALAPASLQQGNDQAGAHIEVPTEDASHELQIGAAPESRVGAGQKGWDGAVEGAPAKTGGWAGKVFKTLFSRAGKEPSPPSTSQTHRPQQESKSQRTTSQAQCTHSPADNSAADPATLQTKDSRHAMSTSRAMPDGTASASALCRQPVTEATSPDMSTAKPWVGTGSRGWGQVSGSPRAVAGLDESPGLAMLGCNAGTADKSPGEAAVNAAFAVAGCIAQDLVPDSAEEADHDTSPSPDSDPGQATSSRPGTYAASAARAAAIKVQNRQCPVASSSDLHAELPPLQPLSSRPAFATAPAQQPAASDTTEASTATLSQHNRSQHAHTVEGQAQQVQRLQSTAQSADSSPPEQATSVKHATAAVPADRQQNNLHPPVSSSAQQDAAAAPAALLPAPAQGKQAQHKDDGVLQGVSIQHMPTHISNSAQSKQAQHLDACMTEAASAEDGLPLSYPATLVATMPCTVPTWLAASQKTAVPTCSAAVPSSSAGASILETQILNATRTYAKSLLGADADSRTAATAGLQVGAPQPALSGSQTTLVLASKGLSNTVPPVQMHAHEADAAIKAASQRHDSQQSTEAPGRCIQSISSDLVHAGHAQQVDCALHAERGKRAAEHSAEHVAEAGSSYKRARSDSPVAAQHDGMRSDRAASYQAPSDADVQELDIFATQQGVSASQPQLAPLQPCHNLHPSLTPPQPPTGASLKGPEQQQRWDQQQVQQQQKQQLPSPSSPVAHQQSFQYLASSQPLSHQGKLHKSPLHAGAKQASDAATATAPQTDAMAAKGEGHKHQQPHKQGHEQQSGGCDHAHNTHSQQIVLAPCVQGNQADIRQGTAKQPSDPGMPTARDRLLITRAEARADPPTGRADLLHQGSASAQQPLQGQVQQASADALAVSTHTLHNQLQKHHAGDGTLGGVLINRGDMGLLQVLQHLQDDASMWSNLQVADVLAAQEVLAQLQLQANASLRKMLAQQD